MRYLSASSTHAERCVACSNNAGRMRARSSDHQFLRSSLLPRGRHPCSSSVPTSASLAVPASAPSKRSRLVISEPSSELARAPPHLAERLWWGVPIATTNAQARTSSSMTWADDVRTADVIAQWHVVGQCTVTTSSTYKWERLTYGPHDPTPPPTPPPGPPPSHDPSQDAPTAALLIKDWLKVHFTKKAITEPGVPGLRRHEQSHFFGDSSRHNTPKTGPFRWCSEHFVTISDRTSTTFRQMSPTFLNGSPTFLNGHQLF